MSGIKTIIFDVGGVLVELGGMQQMHDWTGNIYTDEQLMEVWLKSPSVSRFEAGLCSSEEFAHHIINEMDLPVSPGDFAEGFKTWPTRRFPGVRSLLNQLARRCKLVSLSNTNSMHWPRIMKTLALEPLFHHHFPSHLTGLLKPGQGAFEQVIATLNLSPTSTLFLDDSIINVTAAQQAGLKAIQVRGFKEVGPVLNSLGLLNVA